MSHPMISPVSSEPPAPLRNTALELRAAVALLAHRVVELVRSANEPAPQGMSTRDRLKRARKQLERSRQIEAELEALAARLEA